MMSRRTPAVKARFFNPLELLVFNALLVFVPTKMPCKSVCLSGEYAWTESTYGTVRRGIGNLIYSMSN